MLYMLNVLLHDSHDRALLLVLLCWCCVVALLLLLFWPHLHSFRVLSRPQRFFCSLGCCVGRAASCVWHQSAAQAQQRQQGAIEPGIVVLAADVVLLYIRAAVNLAAVAAAVAPTVLPSRVCVSLHALSAASWSLKVMNPKPRGLFVNLSRITICGQGRKRQSPGRRRAPTPTFVQTAAYHFSNFSIGRKVCTDGICGSKGRGQ